MNAKDKDPIKQKIAKQKFLQSQKAGQTENKGALQQLKMYYLITDWYKDQIGQFLRINQIDHRFIQVKGNSPTKFRYFLLQSKNQLVKFGKIFASKLAQQYLNRSRTVQQEQKNNQTIQDWLRHYSGQIEASKDLPELGDQEISFQYLQKMILQGSANLNLLDLLIQNQISKKKQILSSELKSIKTKTYQTKALIKQSKEECEQPSNKRIEILLKNLQLRLQTIAAKKRVDLAQISQQKTSKKTTQQKPKKLMKIDDLEQELCRVKSVLKNGMWNCLPKIQQRLQKLQQTKNKVVEG